MPKAIIIVEDDRAIRENLQEFLQMEGYPTETAANGQEGLEWIQRLNGNCLVLLDLQMPIMSGEELLDRLMADASPELRETRVLVFTARVEGTTRPNVLATIRKPLQLDEFLRTIEWHWRADAPK